MQPRSRHSRSATASRGALICSLEGRHVPDLELGRPAPRRPEPEELRQVRRDAPRRAVLAGQVPVLDDPTPGLQGWRLLQRVLRTAAAPLQAGMPHGAAALGRLAAEQLRQPAVQVHHHAAPVRAAHEHLVEGVHREVEQARLVLGPLAHEGGGRDRAALVEVVLLLHVVPYDLAAAEEDLEPDHELLGQLRAAAPGRRLRELGAQVWLGHPVGILGDGDPDDLAELPEEVPRLHAEGEEDHTQL
mmetsp:Transcript_15141/g.43226  ORF Transcript_15141/g.43226 Transcript_15141/m.43226 type:complete len:245 (-) Transcript_15141:258-992(-)